MKKIQIQSAILEFDSFDELSDEDKILLIEARKAAEMSYSPYSKFHVGAALLLENSVIVRGNNQENAAYPSGLCAERVAVFSAAAEYPGTKIITMAITAKSELFEINTPVYPCGACRQVLAEYENMNKGNIRIVLQGATGKIHIAEDIKTLLPFMFTSKDLKK